MINIGSENNLIEIVCTVLDIQNLGKNLYFEYKINNDEWRSLENYKLVLSYLQPDNYKIQFRISSLLNKKHSYSPIYILNITPPFHKTYTFFILIILILASLFYLYYSINRANKQKVEKIKSQLSRDLHDFMGSSLSTIALIGDSADINQNEKMYKDLNIVKEEAREMTDFIKSVSWLMKDEASDLKSILYRINLFASTILEAKNIDYGYDFEIQSSISLDLSQRRELFYLLREIINNIAKHSHARTSFFRVIEYNRNVEMYIQDDGKGFDLQTVIGGSGMHNIKVRSQNLKANITCNSSINGTKYFITFKL